MTSKILVPFDGTPLSIAALEKAIDKFPDADLTALHVQNIEDPDYGIYLDVEATKKFQNQPESLASEITDQLREKVRKVGKEWGDSVEFETVRASAARGISTYASEHDIDRIVMGSHGHEDPDKVYLGSVTERVLRRVGTDVTLVRG